MGAADGWGAQPIRRRLTKTLSGPLHLGEQPPSATNGSPRKQLLRLLSWSRLLHSAGGGGAGGSDELGEEWSLDLSRLLVGQRFASGAQSQLYHGIYCGRAVAVKVIRATDLFSRELCFLSTLRHPNVLQLVGACKKESCCCIVTEFMGGGSLRELLERPGEKLPLNRVLALALDVAKGLEYVHSQGVVHRDVKPANLLLDEGGCVKVSDFGVARYEHQCRQAEQGSEHSSIACGTYRWMAPEMVGRRPHGCKVDVYSYGLVLWQLVTHSSLPFPDMNPVQAAYAVVNKHARPPVPQDCHPLLGELMGHCWSSGPEQRPQFSEVVTRLEQLRASQVE